MPHDIHNNGVATEPATGALTKDPEPMPNDFRSEEVTHIISAAPGFWGRWALISFLAILLLLMVGAWFIRYPETINANGVLTATNLPRKLLNHHEGRLTNVFIKDGDTVSVNEVIASLETDTGQLLIRAPEAGKIAFTLMVEKNRWLPAGEVLGFINPVNNHYYVRVHFAQHDLGRLHHGQLVQLSLSAYPSEEFGFLAGKLDYNTLEAKGNECRVNVELLNGLITTNNRTIGFHNELQVRARIVTRQTRLLQRFYNNMFGKVTR